MKYLISIFFILFFLQKSSAAIFPVASENSILFSKIKIDSIPVHINGDTLNIKIAKTKKENKKLIAAILAFPIPFGFVGLHRIYLGTEPWVPVVYMATLGGGMLLPLADFIAIICASAEDLKRMENNPNVFMWVK